MGRINCGDGDGGEPARSPLGRRAFAGQIPKDGIGSDAPSALEGLWHACSDVIKWTRALTVQRSLAEFPFGIRANLLRNNV